MADRHETSAIVEFSWNPGYLSMFISSAALATAPLLVLAAGVRRYLIGSVIVAQVVSLLLLALAPVGAFIGAKRAHQRSRIPLVWSIALGITGLIAAFLVALYATFWLRA